jgi:transposase
MNTKSVRTYTEEFKQSAIQLALRSASILHAAKELGIPSPTLFTWVKQFKEGTIALGATQASIETAETALDPTAARQLKENLAKLLEENRRLNKKVADLEEDRAILKKAAMYFARELR